VGRYIVRRVIWSIFVVFVVTLIAFVIFFVFPSVDPAATFAGRQPTPELLATIREQLGLDRSLPEQYGLYVKHLILGDEYGWPGFGFSFDTRSPIRDEIFDRAIVTVELALGAAVIWLILGVSIGVVSALKRRQLPDRLAMGFALLGISAPVFWLGLVGLYVFWSKLGISPGTGYVGFREDPGGFLYQMWLPWVVLALLFAAVYARVVRGNLIDTMSEDYIRTARAKGLSERRVVAKHGMRAGLVPVVTLLGVDLGTLIGGAIVTETVFNLPGLGQYVLSSIFAGDTPAVMAVVLMTAISVTLLSLVVDIVYAFLDPRIRY
jgi:peptide/nickel transport system permease protein